MEWVAVPTGNWMAVWRDVHAGRRHIVAPRPPAAISYAEAASGQGQLLDLAALSDTLMVHLWGIWDPRLRNYLHCTVRRHVTESSG
jgi:hypothetical protein